MPKAERVIGGGAAGWEPGARCGRASESCTQAASAGSRSRVVVGGADDLVDLREHGFSDGEDRIHLAAVTGSTTGS